MSFRSDESCRQIRSQSKPPAKSVAHNLLHCGRWYFLNGLLNGLFEAVLRIQFGKGGFQRVLEWDHHCDSCLRRWGHPRRQPAGLLRKPVEWNPSVICSATRASQSHCSPFTFPCRTGSMLLVHGTQRCRLKSLLKFSSDPVIEITEDWRPSK